jgi:8-oxo-dGTP pyrophosphatase MutT (NUDIX family)
VTSSDPAERNPWRRRSRRTAYENAWIRVHHDDVVRPDGVDGVYGVVEFRNVAVGVVAIDDDDRLILVGQFRYTHDAYSWEIPEGGVPLDEDPLAGAKRELAEETGFEATDWRELLRLATSNSVTDERGVVYLAAGLTAGTPHPEGTEELRTRWVTLDEAVSMIDRGDIVDAMSQVAILRVALARPADGHSEDRILGRCG